MPTTVGAGGAGNIGKLSLIDTAGLLNVNPIPADITPIPIDLDAV